MINNKINMSQVDDLIIEDKIIDSLNNIADLDYVESMSVSRDIHYCNDIPVGTKVVANRFNAKWIGADIGCGVSVTKLPKGTIDSLDIAYLESELNRGDKSCFNLGTIGGGNHFVEFGYDSKEIEYVTIHSGSRGHGGMISEIIQEFDLKDSLKFNLYNKSIEFSKNNHELLLKKINKDLKLNNIYFHNYVDYTDNKYIHYKGSMNGNKGKSLYPIPANMKDGVFLVVSVHDNIHLPHGAGRLVRRKDARDSLNENDVVSQTTHLKNKVSFNNRDELPSNYKNINDVLNPLVEKGLIRIIDNIKPVINIKG